MIKKLKDFTYTDISNYCNHLWQNTVQGYAVLTIMEFMKNAPEVRFFHKKKDSKIREAWWQEHKFELIKEENAEDKIDLDTWNFIE